MLGERAIALLNMIARKFWSTFCTARGEDIYSSFRDICCLWFLVPQDRNFNRIRHYVDMRRLTTETRSEEFSSLGDFVVQFTSHAIRQNSLFLFLRKAKCFD